MTVRVINIKIRPNTTIPFKNPDLFLNHSTWPGYIDGISLELSNQDLVQTMISRWESREYYSNPVLTSGQLEIKQASEQWLIDNNITLLVEIIEE
jgi:hypothetical protein